MTARIEHGYVTTSRPERRWLTWAGAAGGLIAFTAAAMLCQPEAAAPPAPTSFEVREQAFLAAPSVAAVPASDDDKKLMASTACAQMRAAGPRADLMLVVRSAVEQLQGSWPQLPQTSIGAVVGAGSVAYCPELGIRIAAGGN